jgi:hypothetical protein
VIVFRSSTYSFTAKDIGPPAAHDLIPLWQPNIEIFVVIPFGDISARGEPDIFKTFYVLNGFLQISDTVRLAHKEMMDADAHDTGLCSALAIQGCSSSALLKVVEGL